MSSPEFPEAFARAVRGIEQALRRDLRTPDLVRGHVAARHVDHWRRFGNLPSALVRDLACEAKRADLKRRGAYSPAAEADVVAYAETFLRSFLEGGFEPESA